MKILCILLNYTILSLFYYLHKIQIILKKSYHPAIILTVNKLIISHISLSLKKRTMIARQGRAQSTRFYVSFPPAPWPLRVSTSSRIQFAARFSIYGAQSTSNWVFLSHYCSDLCQNRLHVSSFHTIAFLHFTPRFTLLQHVSSFHTTATTVTRLLSYRH